MVLVLAAHALLDLVHPEVEGVLDIAGKVLGRVEGGDLPVGKGEVKMVILGIFNSLHYYKRAVTIAQQCVIIETCQ